MSTFQNDISEVHELVGTAYGKAECLLSLTDGGQMPDCKLQQTLEQTAHLFETATLRLRTLCERSMPGAGRCGTAYHTTDLPVTGFAEVTEEGWLHIQINTLLPHCRYCPPGWLTHTILRLLNEASEPLPFFDHAFLVLEEHSAVKSRRIFDQDNKGWKAVSNALKGWVVADDDQYHLSVALLSVPSTQNLCHIYLVPMEHAALYFVRSQQKRRRKAKAESEPWRR